MKKFILVLALALTSFIVSAQDYYIGEVRLVAFNYAPQGWALCNGQILQISQNQALYALLGNTYGGDGRSTFALPDLRGRLPIHTGQGQSLPPFQWGQKSGLASPLAYPVPGKADSTGRGPAFYTSTPAAISPNNYPPTLGMNYIIALNGLWPPRD
jgi:microcystin-dependent protein